MIDLAKAIARFGNQFFKRTRDEFESDAKATAEEMRNKRMKSEYSTFSFGCQIS